MPSETRTSLLCLLSPGWWDVHWERVWPWPDNSLPAGYSQCALSTANILCSQCAMAQKSILVSPTPGCHIFCCRFRDTLLLFACVIKVLLFYTINFDDCQCQEKGCLHMFIFLYIWPSEQRVLAPGSKDDWIQTLKIETFREIQIYVPEAICLSSRVV